MNRKQAAVIGGLMVGLVAISVALGLQPPTPLSDPAPTSIITAPPRTPRSIIIVTATGTRAPTPTVEGFWMFDTSAMFGLGCIAAAQTPVATVPAAGTITETDGSLVSKDVALCNLNDYPITVSWRTRIEYEGFSYSGSAVNHCLTAPYSCSPAFATWNTANIYNEQPCTGSLFGAHREYDETRIVVLNPYSANTNAYEFTLDALGLGAGACGAQLSEVQWNIVPVWDANPGGGNPTPTRNPAATPWITEVLARPQGTTCGDWNLRAGCADNDQFVEVGVPSAMSLAGYRVDVVDGVDAVACTMTFAADDWTEPLKVAWQDYGWLGPTPTVTPTGTPGPSGGINNCGQWPETGAAKLYNAAGNLIDTRAYDYSGGGQYGDSWAATDWTNPDGLWWWYSPSPGAGNRIPPTSTPTP